MVAEKSIAETIVILQRHDRIAEKRTTYHLTLDLFKNRTDTAKQPQKPSWNNSVKSASIEQRLENFINRVDQFAEFYGCDDYETCYQAGAYVRGTSLSYVKRSPIASAEKQY